MQSRKYKENEEEEYKCKILWEKPTGRGGYNRRMMEVEVSLYETSKNKVKRQSTLVTYPSPDNRKNEIAVSTREHKVRQV